MTVVNVTACHVGTRWFKQTNKFPPCYISCIYRVIKVRRLYEREVACSASDRQGWSPVSVEQLNLITSLGLNISYPSSAYYVQRSDLKLYKFILHCFNAPSMHVPTDWWTT